MPLLRPLQKARFATGSPGFTLVELLTVIAIIGILAAILIPVVGRVRETARTSNCARNLSSLGVAFQLYAADNKGLYPSVRTQNANRDKPGANPTGKNWQEELFPYQTREAGDIGDLNDSVDSYVYCPEFVSRYKGDPKWRAETQTTGGYGMNPSLGFNAYDNRFRAAAIQQPSRTVLLGDSGSHILSAGNSWAMSASRLGGYTTGDPVRHRGSANYLFADGHVSLLDPDAALDALNL